MLTFTQTIIVAVLVVLLITAVWTHLGDPRRNFAGLWLGTPSFNEAALLNDMILHVEPGTSSGLMAPFGGTKYLAYLFMVNTSGDIVCSQPVEIWANFGFGLWRSDEYSCDASLVFPNLSESDTEDAPWPDNVKLEMNTQTGELWVSSDTQRLAVLQKTFVDEEQQ